MSKKFTTQSGKYAVRDFGAYTAMMEKLEEEGLKDAVNLLVATPVDSIDQYEAKAKTVENEYGHYGFTALVRLISDAANAAQSCALENMLKEACDEGKKIAKFRAPSTCRQYKSACACVLASKLRDPKDDNRLMPLSQEEDNLLNQMCNSYEVQFAQMVFAGFIEPKKGGRGALRRTMLDQLIRLAEQEGEAGVALGLEILYSFGCRSRDIRDLCLVRIELVESKGEDGEPLFSLVLMCMPKGSTAKALAQGGLSPHFSVDAKGDAAIQKLVEMAKKANLREDVSIISRWKSHILKGLIDKAKERFQWPDELDWVIHCIRHGICSDLEEEMSDDKELFVSNSNAVLDWVPKSVMGQKVYGLRERSTIAKNLKKQIGGKMALDPTAQKRVRERLAKFCLNSTFNRNDQVDEKRLAQWMLAEAQRMANGEEGAGDEAKEVATEGSDKAESVSSQEHAGNVGTIMKLMIAGVNASGSPKRKRMRRRGQNSPSPKKAAKKEEAKTAKTKGARRPRAKKA